MLRLTRGDSVFFVNPYAVILVNKGTLSVTTPTPTEGADHKVGEVKPVTCILLQDGSTLTVDEHPGEVAVLVERILHEERLGTLAFPTRGDAWKGK